MTTYSAEFDTTIDGLVAAPKAQILNCTDWADITTTTQLLATSASTAAAATSLPFTSTSGFPLAVGDTIAVGSGAQREYRVIATVTSTAITLTAGLTLAHPSGEGIFSGANLLKATTTRGAQMVVDLTAGPPSLARLAMAAYRTHSGTINGGVDKVLRYVQHRRSNGVGSNLVHCFVSVSKEHLFFWIEGPRAGEANPSNTQYGSARGYFFIADVVPYDAADTVPAVVIGSTMTYDTPDATIAQMNQLAQVSRNMANTQSWVQALLLAPCHPQMFSGHVFHYQPEWSSSKFGLYPYFVMERDGGHRGRLDTILHAGFTDVTIGSEPTAQLGRTVVYSGKRYKITQSSKSDNNSTSDVWGPLGSVINNNAAFRGIAVAVPVADVP